MVSKRKPKGLQERDSDPNSGRDSQHAADNAFKALGRQPPEPKPLVILPFESTLAFVFKGAGGKQTAVEAARMIQDDDERLQKVVFAWDQATERDKEKVKLEDLCSAADITPDEFLGLIIPALWRRNLDIGKIIAAMAHPEIVAASVQAAKTTWGTLDRQMLHTQSGFLPTKAGQQINIDNRKQTVVAGGSGSAKDTSAPGLPSFEQEMIEGAEVLRGDAGRDSEGHKQIAAPTRQLTAANDREIERVLDAEIVD